MLLRSVSKFIHSCSTSIILVLYNFKGALSTVVQPYLLLYMVFFVTV